MKKKSTTIIAFTLFAAVLVCMSATNAFAAWAPPTSFTIRQAATPPTIDGKADVSEWGLPAVSRRHPDPKQYSQQ